MTSQSGNQGLVFVGSKMKIKLAKQSEEEGIEKDEKEMVKKEAGVQEEQSCEWPTTSSSDQSLKSSEEEKEEEEEEEDNLTLAELSNSNPRPPTPSPSSPGKRKKKPKEMPEDFCCQFKMFKRKKRKLPAASKSKHAVSNHSGKSMSYKREKSAVIGLYSPIQVKTPTMIRAEEVKSSLGSEFPSFAKLLVRSHVSSCFWMGLPMPFCKTHLPREDTTVILEDENGEQFELKFIAEKTGLSAGWRKFVAGHKLLEGDVLIFQLVEPNKFKVYVVRANNLTEVDGALGLLNLDVHSKQNNDTEKVDADDGEIDLNNKKRKHPKSLPLAVVQKKMKKIGLPKSVPKPIQSIEQFENDSEEVGSEVILGHRFSDSAVRFRHIKTFEDFNIVVNGLCIDSELPEHIRVKYYELCRSKNAFIHARLLRGLNSKLVGGIICEIVNIADAMRACKLTTPREEFSVWEKSLKSFEVMGMNVGFLRARLRRLVSFAFDSEGALDARRYLEAKSGSVRAADEIRNLEAKLVELKEASEKYVSDIESLKSTAESYEQKFQEEVDAPW